MTTAHRLLLVEDSEPLGRQIVGALEAAGYEITWIRDGGEALGAAFDGYSLAILDLMLPGASGFDILARLRGQGITIPVLITSARSDSSDKQRAADLGASEYLTKPFWPQELLALVARLLATGGRSDKDARAHDDFAIDLAARPARIGDQEIPLAPAEFDVLAALVRRRGAVVSRAWLLDQITDPACRSEVQAVDRYVSRIKEKLGPAGARIRAVWGVGYVLDA